MSQLHCRICVVFVCIAVITSPVWALTIYDPSPWAENNPIPSVDYEDGCNGVDDGSDFDQNGLSDGLELFLAETFKPVFYINRGNPLSPEPVEILDRNGDGILGAEDAFVSVLYTEQVTGVLGAFRAPFCDALPNAVGCQSVDDYFQQPTDGAYSGLFPSGADPVPGSSTFSTFYDYGAVEDDGAANWQSIYTGSSSFGGAAHAPKIYCHFRNGSPQAGQIEIQYWFFYPYNDGYNDHEGDWEHITVAVGKNGDCGYQMKTVYFFFHEDYYDWTVSSEDAPYHIDNTHTVVFVGGTIQGSGGTGDEGGGSYPMFGDFLTRWDVTEHVRPEGATLHYGEVEVEVIPNVTGAVDLSEWYSEDPHRQWMSRKAQWGFPESDSPGGISNDAPFTPAHKDTWNSTTGGAYQRPPEMFFDDWIARKSIVMVSPMAEGSFVPARIKYEGWSNSNEVLERRGTHHITVEDPDRNVKLTAESLFEDENGDWYRFVDWGFGVDDNPIYLDTPPDYPDWIPGHYHLKAQYERVVLSPEVNIGSVEVAVVVPEGSEADGVMKSQCTDGNGNLFVAWCEASGAVGVQRFDTRLNPAWAGGGVSLGSVSGGTASAIQIVIDPASGGVVVVWHEAVEAGEDQIYASRIGDSGSLVAGPLLVHGGELDSSEAIPGGRYLWAIGAPKSKPNGWDSSVFVVWRDIGGGLSSNLIDLSGGTFSLAWGGGRDLLNGYSSCSALNLVAMTEGGHFFVVFTSNDGSSYTANLQMVSRLGQVTIPDGGRILVPNSQVAAAELTDDLGLALVVGTPDLEETSTPKIYWFDGLQNVRGSQNLEIELVPGFSAMVDGAITGYQAGTGPAMQRYDHGSMASLWPVVSLFNSGDLMARSELGSGDIVIQDNGIAVVAWDQTSAYFGAPSRDYMVQRVELSTGIALWTEGHQIQESGKISNLVLFESSGTIATWFSSGHLMAKHTHNPFESVHISSNCNSLSPSGFVFSCPQGDADSYVVSIDFDDAEMARDVSASEVSIAAGEIIDQGAADVVFAGPAPLTADDNATAANGYAMSITVGAIGGWGRTLVPVMLDGVHLGDADLFLKTPDCSPDLTINLSDAVKIGIALGTSEGETNYDEFLDWVPYPGPSDGVINISDVTVFAQHLYHHDLDKMDGGFGEEARHPSASLTLEEIATESQKNGDGRPVFDLSISPTSDILAMDVLIDLPEEWQGEWEWNPDPELPALALRIPVSAGAVSRAAILVIGIRGTISRIGTFVGPPDGAASKSAQRPSVDRASLVDESGRIWALGRAAANEPKELQDRLDGAAPNPFNPSTKISYELKAATQVELAIFDLRGRKVVTLYQGNQGAGPHTVIWSGLNENSEPVASGVYLYRLLAGEFRESKKLLLLK